MEDTRQTQKGHVTITWISHDHTNLRVIGDILGTGSYDPNGFHTGVSEGSFAGNCWHRGMRQRSVDGKSGLERDRHEYQ